MNKVNNIDEVYIVIFAIYSKKYYTLWYTGQKDGFILERNNLYIKSFSDMNSIKIFTEKNDIILKDEITEILCDKTILFDLNKVDCNNILTFWNIISDIANTLNIKFLGDCNDKMIVQSYNKLFYGCNLPAIKEKNRDFIPEWSNSDKEILLKVIKNGFDILVSSLGIG